MLTETNPLRSPNELPFFEPEKVTPLPSGTMRELTMILKELRVLTDKLKADEEDDAMENDWKFAAMVLDRLCLITFTGFTMLATAALLITAPPCHCQLAKRGRTRTFFPTVQFNCALCMMDGDQK